MWAIERVIHVWPRANTMVYIGLAGITCSCLMWLTGQQYWWLGMLCGSFAYPFLLVALRVFSVDEVLSLVRRKSGKSGMISVVIPTRDRQEILGCTLERLSHQDLAPDEYEILIVDDGSPRSWT